ncbi:N-acetyl sugar amidotransferase [Pedobacter punctiformis]|uniref:N-acetyl sugar amidotransferase n=1 Tax=Pedobacter punctiformis TaxID=3004097 RepID=A0ABT4L4S8_9SPHI|nr:N-acetyl sugar amidotransferase [Pedobacter sp. HCMS5-2]MCZ4242908.1 N-acetyl sugar amidotransferase [Pedobacter sp. HCMS5-2]
MDYQICQKTIMDTSDLNISFNEMGESDYFTNFRDNIVPNWKFGNNQQAFLHKMAEKIKSVKTGNFDCILGISGGLDSSYAAYVVKEIMGLRPLLYHVDAGWNTHIASKNIDNLVQGLNLDLVTDVINWEEMKDLQLSFLKSQIPDQDIPQDAAFFSSLYRFARKYKIKYVITGGNFSTECCREPNDWGAYPGVDSRLIGNIHKQFGTKELKKFPIMDILDYKILNRYMYGIKVFTPLNYTPFVKIEAERLLARKFKWTPFQHKHHESRFTRFYEDYWLPNKFGYDRRKVHFSSLILTGQMTREEALIRISKPEMSQELLAVEFEYIADKLDLNRDQLMDIFNKPNKTAYDYPNKIRLIKIGSKMLRLFGKEKRLYR